MNGLDLFAGSGIGSLAFKYTIPNYRTVCYVENDPYCQAVLVARIKDGLLEDAPIWDDVRTFDGTKWRGRVDIVSGGFPCQPFSVAGQRKGDADERNLWPDTVRIIGEVRPRYAFLENVPGLLSSGYFETILCDLAKIGYDIEWDIVGASDVGANHRRKRLWMLAWDTDSRDGNERSVSRMAERQEAEPARSRNDVADPNGARELQSQGIEQDERGRISNDSQDVGDTPDKGLEGAESTSQVSGKRRRLPAECSAMENSTGKRLEEQKLQQESAINTAAGWWQAEPDVGRVAHGIPCRVDRLKMLGNAWVPHVVRRILRGF